MFNFEIVYSFVFVGVASFGVSIIGLLLLLKQIGENLFLVALVDILVHTYSMDFSFRDFSFLHRN